MDITLVHIPKTAGTTVAKAIPSLKRKHHLARIWCELQPELWRKSVTASFIRNPWDRAVSWYYWHECYRRCPCGVFDDTCPHTDMRKGVPFNDWIRRGCPHHMRDYKMQGIATPVGFDPLDQMQYLIDETGMIIVNFIGHYESLHADIKRLAEQAEVRTQGLQHLNKSRRPKQPYQDLYEPDTIELLADHCRPFIERFGYSFD